MGIELQTYWLKRWRWHLLGGLALLLAAAIAFWPSAEEVDVAKVTRGSLVVGVTDDGVTRAEEFYVISAPVTGYLARVELEPGDFVRRGQVVARMTGSASMPLDLRTQHTLRASLAAARANERALNSTLEQAQQDLTRAEELSSRGFLSRAQLEQGRTRVNTARAALEEARANSARISAEMSGTSGKPTSQAIPVTAPANGAVMTVITESEGEIPQGTSLMTIGDSKNVEAVIDLLSRDAVKVSVGDPVLVTGWGGARPLVGKVKRIEPFGKLKVSALGIEEQRVNVIVGFANAAEAARLGHGFQIDATVILWRSAEALRIPIAAIFRGADNKWRAFVNDGGRARLTKINLGHMTDEFAEVLSGLKEGDEVILSPPTSMIDGLRVTPR